MSKSSQSVIYLSPEFELQESDDSMEFDSVELNSEVLTSRSPILHSDFDASSIKVSQRNTSSTHVASQPVSIKRPVESEKEVMQISLEEIEETLVPFENTSSENTLERSLSDLSRLVANVTEAYSATVFLVDTKEHCLTVGGFHSLSRDFIPEAKVGFGCGLVGWTAENGVRISVCPFEHNATTLLYYKKDQALKSFIAVPVHSAEGSLVGVIACDSKKSYAFSKIAEKILMDCAKQVATLVRLHNFLKVNKTPDESTKDSLSQLIEKLQSAMEEEELLKIAAKMPQDIIAHDAFVVIAADEDSNLPGEYYSASKDGAMDHRLLQTICRHRKVMFSQKSVHSLPVDDAKQRSFFSIPLQAFGKEVGSLNVLSKPFEAFHATEIGTLEKLSKVIERELENIRARQSVSPAKEMTGLLSWKSFSRKAQAKLSVQGDESQSLVRISLENLVDIEDYLGAETAQNVMHRLMRLVDQVKRPQALSTYLYGYQMLLLTDKSESEATIKRLQRLVEHTSFKDIHSAGVNLGEMVAKGLKVASAHHGIDGETLDELLAKTLRLLKLSLTEHPEEIREHARAWAQF